MVKNVNEGESSFLDDYFDEREQTFLITAFKSGDVRALGEHFFAKGLDLVEEGEQFFGALSDGSEPKPEDIRAIITDVDSMQDVSIDCVMSAKGRQYHWALERSLPLKMAILLIINMHLANGSKVTMEEFRRMVGAAWAIMLRW